MKRTHIFAIGFLAGFFLINFLRSGTPIINVYRDTVLTDTVYLTDTVFIYSFEVNTAPEPQKSLTTEENAVIDYIKRYSGIAIKEYEQFGILPSIKLGQAILESGAGSSRMSQEANNHFAIKWRDWSELFPSNHREIALQKYYASDDCPELCAFTHFTSVWASYRAHSVLLSGSRYKDVVKAKTAHSAAKALQSAGYATDPDYSKKLIGVIEKYGLRKFDS